MDQVAEFDAWQIDPITSRIRLSEALRDPVVVVVEEMPSLAVAIAEICDFLCIGIVHVEAPCNLAPVLQKFRPIAVLGESGEVDCGVYDLLRSVAGYDTELPVLIVLGESEINRGALENAQKLWQRTDIVRFGHRPGIRALIEFLFFAGRKSGTSRLARQQALLA